MKSIPGLSMKTLEALRKLSPDKLAWEIKDAEKQYYTMRMKHTLGEEKQPHLFRYLRRYIATLKTLQNEAK